MRKSICSYAVIALWMVLSAGQVFAEAPTSDGSLFIGDCNDPGLTDWIRVQGNCEHDSSERAIHIQSGTFEEGFAWANMR